MEAVLTDISVRPPVKRLNLFEKYLTIWVGLCMVAGVALGKWAPHFVQTVRSMEFREGSHINVPIAVLIWLMIVPMIAMAMVGAIFLGSSPARAAPAAPSARFIEGAVMDQLRDGRSVRVDFALTVLHAPRGSVIAEARQSFTLSFDLWEQRFAVTRIGPMPRSISHLTARAAEDWCLDNVTVPVASLGRTARDTPFWVRVEYRIPDRSTTAGPDDSTFTLQTLIDVLSRRREDENRGKSVEAGPFRLSP